MRMTENTLKKKKATPQVCQRKGPKLLWETDSPYYIGLRVHSLKERNKCMNHQPQSDEKQNG